MAKRFGFQFAYPLEERRLLDPKFGWDFPRTPVITQPKLDGERARNDGSDLFSSEGNPIISVPHINVAIEEQVLGSFALDGELWHPDLSFSEIDSRVSRQSYKTLHPLAHEIGFHVFDIIDETMKQHIRTIFLADSSLQPPLFMVPYKVATSFDQIMEQYQEYLAQGYEGIIVRQINQKYVTKRSTFMLKFKPKKHDFYQIVDVNEAISKGGQPLAMVGAFVCQDMDGTTFNVGAGELDHLERRKYWIDYLENRVVGSWCMVSYQHLTSANGVPRFGLAVSVDTEGEKA
jgi:ATP-dependent DNA ligase